MERTIQMPKISMDDLFLSRIGVIDDLDVGDDDDQTSEEELRERRLLDREQMVGRREQDCSRREQDCNRKERDLRELSNRAGTDKRSFYTFMSDVWQKYLHDGNVDILVDALEIEFAVSHEEIGEASNVIDPDTTREDQEAQEVDGVVQRMAEQQRRIDWGDQPEDTWNTASTVRDSWDAYFEDEDVY